MRQFNAVSEKTGSVIDKSTAHKPIGLVKAIFAEPFRAAMLNNGVDPDRYFRKYRLPVGKLEDPELKLPVKSFFHLINHVAIAEQIPDFGMQVAQVRPWYQIETMHSLLAAQPNLEALLTTFCQIASDESNVAIFDLHGRDRICHFRYMSPPHIRNDIQMELYRVTSMIELVQVFAGKRWRPQSVDLMMNPNRVAALNSIVDGCQLNFSQPGTAIDIPEQLLSQSQHSTASLKPAADLNYKSVGRLGYDDDLVTPLSGILQSYITEPDLSLALVADIIGLTPRDLQRKLSFQGSSYRDLLNDARRDYALRQLRESNLSISDIARRLGYREAGHFTRAFKRWTGMTPSDYQNQLQNH